MKKFTEFTAKHLASFHRNAIELERAIKGYSLFFLFNGLLNEINELKDRTERLEGILNANTYTKND